MALSSKQMKLQSCEKIADLSILLNIIFLSLFSFLIKCHPINILKRKKGRKRESKCLTAKRESKVKSFFQAISIANPSFLDKSGH